MDCFTKRCAHFFHYRRLKGYLSLFVCIQFFRQHVYITVQHALVFTIKKKIALASNACSKPLIIIKSNDLHADNIRRPVGEMTSYHERESSSLPLFGAFGLCSFWPFVGPFLSPMGLFQP